LLGYQASVPARRARRPPPARESAIGPTRMDPRQQRACGFIGGVLRDEPALEGGLEDRLFQPRGVSLGVGQGLRVGGRGQGIGDATEDFALFPRVGAPDTQKRSICEVNMC
jgi:hypothetical protein